MEHNSSGEVRSGQAGSAVGELERIQLPRGARSWRENVPVYNPADDDNAAHQFDVKNPADANIIAGGDVRTIKLDAALAQVGIRAEVGDDGVAHDGGVVGEAVEVEARRYDASMYETAGDGIAHDVDDGVACEDIATHRPVVDSATVRQPQHNVAHDVICNQ